ncbi:MAG: SDR family oxidoreductase [Deltaproteobacteria bacterium]|nr:SDR family oxidoreductase [Deltaproteobacteria bacterium]
MSEALRGFGVAGKVAVVTGAARGIGLGVAELLAQAGARVVAARVDVSRRADFDALVDSAVARFGRLDVLANVAGVLRVAPTLEMSEDDIDLLLGVNLKGVLNGCRSAARAMSKSGGGAIVNIASSAAYHAYPHYGIYGATKAGVVALTRVLAKELAPSIRVNAIAPGMVDTQMAGRRYRNADGTQSEAQRAAMLAEMKERSPLGIPGEPRDIAEAVLYLASDASRYTTGQVLHPNGGALMVS